MVKHGLSGHPLFKVWGLIRERCNKPYATHYNDYGGRGITICQEWDNSFKSFYDWSLQNGWHKGLNIDRINNDGNYEPSNCRFVTDKENCRNRRSNRLITHNGETKSVSEWAEVFNLSHHTIRERLNMKWPSDKLFIPKQQGVKL